MVEVTFVLGNGFDRACGMKTAYTDTYDGFVKTPELSHANATFKKTIEKDIPSWADFEMKMAEYAKLFSSENEFIESVRDYIDYLNEYLLQQQTAFNNTVFANAKIRGAVLTEILSSVSSFCNGFTANEHHALDRILGYSSQRYNFVTFNYTSTIDQLVEDLKSAYSRPNTERYIGKTIHIHGTLNNDVILGVNDESQISNLPYKLSRRGKRVFIKPFLLEQYDKNRLMDAKATIAESDVICVFGLSLGESDNTWKDALANWVLASTAHHLVFYVHSYSSRSYPRANITLRMDDGDECKEKVIKRLFGDTLDIDSYNQVYDQIHVPIGSTIFKVEQAIATAKEEIISKGASVARPPVHA